MTFSKNLSQWASKMNPRKIIFLFVFSLLIISTISALQIDSKDTLNKDETVLIKITGNFLNPILRNNLILQRDHVKVSSDFELIKVNDIYYIATQLLDKNPGNYSVVIKEASYQKGNTIIDEDISVNFTILDTQADFYITPGIIYTNENFEVKVQNLQASNLDIGIKLTEYYKQGISSTNNNEETVFEALFGTTTIVKEREIESTSITLKSGEIKYIPFKAKDFRNDSLRIITFISANTEYTLPVFVFLNETRDDRPIELVTRFDPAVKNISMITNSTKTFIFHFYNDGDEEIENITFTVSPSFDSFVNLSLTELEDLDADSSVTIEAYLTSTEQGLSVEGFISAASGTVALSDSELTLNFIQGYVPLPGEETEIIIEDKEETKSYGKTIGIIIILLVVAFAIWFYFKKFRKAKLKPALIKRALPPRPEAKPALKE